MTRDPWTYQRYLRASAGEWSVAKHGYVTARTGWFSERSAGYLASGRPVVVQDTGFAHDQLPVGEGLLAFDDLEGARGGIEQVRARPAVHQHAAREIAREHFASDRVLPRLLDAVTGAPSAGGAAGCGGGTVRR